MYVSISAFGQTGPYRDRPAHDLAVEAMSGVLSVNLGWDDRPWLPAIACADMLACNMALWGVLMALLRRQTTGKGDYLDIAMMDALIASLPNGYGVPMTERRQPVAKHERTWGGNAMYRVYETQDGKFVVLGGAELEIRDQLADRARPARSDPAVPAAARPGPGPRARFPDGNVSDQNPGRVGATGWRARTSRSRRSRPCARGSTIPRPATARWWSRTARGWEHLGIPHKFADEPGRVRFDLPGHGEHSEEILRGLGYSDAELAAMKADGVY